ncbi:MAG: Integral membrane protein TerC [Planctomycetota bacterium]|nr:MAG: Integral membrane protein TerC [Planctomycetota bacterium]
MNLELLLSILQIILIDVVLSGDNAVVIAMAAHKLPEHQRKRAILWGGGIAIGLRIVFTMIMSFLLMVPTLRLLGGLLLVWIACKLLCSEEEEEVTADSAGRSTIAAIKMIFLADFAMSLDNMLAVAGASHGNWKLLLGGLVISIAIIMTCSNLIAQLMNRYKWIVTLGAAILAFTAGEMMMGDREVAGYFVRNHQVSLDKHWEAYVVTHAHVSQFEGGDSLPEELQDVVTFEPGANANQTGKLKFIGQMTEIQRDALVKRTGEKDKEKIEELFEETRHRDVPNWVPQGLRGVVEPWFQLKWPAKNWQAIQGNQQHYVSWIFFGLVIAFCLTSPRWWPGAAKSHSSEPDQPSVPTAS